MSEPVNLPPPVPQQPQGGLSGQQPPPPPPPPQGGPSNQNPYGYSMDARLLAQSMNPEALMNIVNKNTVSDDEIRRNKFFAGLSGPTRSGSVGESYSNAMNAYADTAMDQKKLIMQYAPLMAQHMLGMYNASITGAEKNTERNQKWESGLNAAVTGLLRSGAPVTPEAISFQTDRAGQELGIDPAYRQTYLSGLGVYDVPPGTNMTQAIQTRLLSSLAPDKQLDTLSPPNKQTDVGGKFTPLPEGSRSGFTPPSAAGPAATNKSIEPLKPEEFIDKWGGKHITYKGMVAEAGTPEASQLYAQYDKDRQAAIAAAGPAPSGPPPGQQPPPPPQGAGGPPPGPPAGAPPAQPPGPPPGQQAPPPQPPAPPPQPPGPPPTQVPQALPPGAKLPAGLSMPPRPAPQGPDATQPGAISPPGGMPGAPMQGRLAILQQELAQTTDPSDRASLIRQIAAVQGQATGQPAITQPTPVAPGVVATPRAQPDPVLQGNDLNVKNGVLPANADVKFTDIPQAPPLMKPNGAVNPIQEQAQKDALTAFQKDTAEHNKVVTSMGETLRRLQVIQDLAQNVQLGKTAGAREEVGGLVADIGNMLPGVSSETVRSWADAIANGGTDKSGALSALQALEKLTVSGAMVSLRADIGSSGGQRIAMQEFMQYLRAVPNAEMTPAAIARLREIGIKDYLKARTEQDARAAFASSGNADYSQFDKYWANKQQQLGYVKTNLNVGGGTGSGLPYQDVNFVRDQQGRVLVQDPKTNKYYLPNDKFLMSGWK